MDALGWDSCDVIVVTGDAYVDHPSFGMAVIGRVLEAQGFRVGIIAQPDWQSPNRSRRWAPNLFFGVTAGNMDSMINRYTGGPQDPQRRRLHARRRGCQTAGPRALVHAQRAGKPSTRCPCGRRHRGQPAPHRALRLLAGQGAPLASWSTARPTLLFGNAERAIVEIAHRLARGAGRRRSPTCAAPPSSAQRRPERRGLVRIDSSEVDRPAASTRTSTPTRPPASRRPGATCASCGGQAPDEGASRSSSCLGRGAVGPHHDAAARAHRDPPASYEQVKSDPVLYAHANRVLHRDQPGNARAGAGHGDATARDVWINPPPIPLTTAEMDHVFDLPYARSPHPRYADENGGHDGATKIPAWEMIRFSINIMRGCFGGCTFCSITEHEGRIIQSRSGRSVIREIEEIRDKVKGFTGVISDLGGPTANMYRWAASRPRSRRPAASRAAWPRHLPEPEHRPRRSSSTAARDCSASRRS